MAKKRIKKKDIVETLQSHFHDAKVSIKWNEETEHYYGRILWAGFEDQSLLERHHSVFEVLREKFGRDETREAFSMLFIYTPHEYELLEAVA